VWAEALKLARKGVDVFPCGTDKRPLTSHGFKNATTDADVVHSCWTRWPDAPVRVQTGERFTVLDLDLQGEDALPRYYNNRERLPLSRTHVTRSAGRHLLFKPADIGCSVGKVARGVYVRGRGGYIGWWPASGFDVLHGDALAEMPYRLIEELQKPPPSAQNRPGVRFYRSAALYTRGSLRISADRRNVKESARQGKDLSGYRRD
jgi:hypothetical protein